jgi:hypothetical protein
MVTGLSSDINWSAGGGHAQGKHLKCAGKIGYSENRRAGFMSGTRRKITIN